MSPEGDGEQGGVPTIINASTASGEPPRSPPVPPMSPPGDHGGASGGNGSFRVPGLPRRYRVRCLLGTGGYGSVYEAYDRLLGIDVAIKVVSRAAGAPGASNGTSARRAILGEAKKLAQVSSFPGIVRLHTAEFFTDPVSGDRRLYLVMDLVRDAQGLVRYADEKKLSIDQRVDLFIRVSDAVHFLHKIGIVHRDLKPANILMGRSPGETEDRPHIIDFGIARQTGVNLDERRGVEGTLAYMSPEQTREQRDLTAASDVYTLGVILYLLLCGRLPYSTERLSLDEAFRVIRRESPDLESGPARHLPDDLRAIISRAMSKTIPGETGSLEDGDPRYADAGDLATALRKYRRGEPVGPRPWFVGATQFVRRALARPMVGLVAALVLSVLVADRVVAPLAYLRTGLSSWFERATVPPISEFKDVVLVSVGKKEYADAGEGPGALRPLLARLVERVASASPKVIALDYFFPELGGGNAATGMDNPAARTQALASAIRSAAGAGKDRQSIPIVIGIESWAIDSRTGALDPSVMAPALFELTKPPGPTLRFGGVIADIPPEKGPPREWKTILMEERLGVIAQPGLALQVVMAAMESTRLPIYELDVARDQVEVNFKSMDAVAGAATAPIDPTLQRIVRATQIVRESSQPKPIAAEAVDRDLFTAWLRVMHPDLSVFRSATIDAADILAGVPRELERCHGKIVLIVNAGEEKGATFLRDARPRWHAQALAIESLLKSAVTYPTANQEVLIMIAGGALGWVVVRPIGRRYSWWPRWWVAARWGVWALAALAVVAAAVWLAWASSYVFNPAVPLGAAIVAALVGLVAGEARRRPLVEGSA